MVNDINAVRKSTNKFATISSLSFKSSNNLKYIFASIHANKFLSLLCVIPINILRISACKDDGI